MDSLLAIVLCLLGSGGLLGSEAAPAAATPGDLADGDPTTFSFHSDNRLAPLLGADGYPLRPEAVPYDYGRHYAVLAGGLDVASVEYAWALGHGGDHPRLQVRYQDLSRPEEAAVENGWVAIDPTTARFKFARRNQVSDPLRLEHRRQVVLGNLTPWRLEARGKFAFAVQEEEVHALQAYDASDPSAFRYGGYSSAGGYPFGFALGETHAYVSGSGYLSVHDIRDPRALRYVKTFHNEGSEKPHEIQVDVERKRLYQSSQHGLQVFDISDGDDPVLLAIHDGLQLPFLQAQGGLLYGLRKGEGEGDQAIFTYLLIHREREGAAPEEAELDQIAEFPVAGKLESSRNGIRHLLVSGKLAFLILSTGLHVISVEDPRRPRRLAQLHDLFPVPEYYEKGSGAHDVAVQGPHLFVACGRSRGGLVNPRDTGLYRDHVDFEERVLAPRRERDLRGHWRGGLRIYDLSDPSAPRLITELDDEAIGYDAITNVAVGEGVLFLLSRMAGVLAYDISDVRRPRFRGLLSSTGEVDCARLVGDKLYALGNGLYVIEPYPAREASLLGFCYTDSFMFGRSLVMNPFVQENPQQLLFTLSGTWHRQVTARDPARPLLTDFHSPPVGYGRWKGAHLYVPGGKSLDIYRMEAEGRPQLALRFPVEGPATHLEIHGKHIFLFGLARDLDHPVNFLEVFELQEPEKLRQVAVLKGPTDCGAMFSPEVFYYRGFCFLPGWYSARHAGGGQGWGNFLGVRVLDVRQPRQPRVHCLIHHLPADLSVNSLSCAMSFHASGDTLYIADYWTGIHVIDISELAASKRWRHLGVVKDRSLPWSVASYCTSASGYGRYLYTTHFGHVNIWEIPAEDDLPRAELTVQVPEGAARR